MPLKDSSGLRTLGSLQLWSAAFLLEKQASLWLAGLRSFKHFIGKKRVNNIIAILPTCVWDCVCVLLLLYMCVYAHWVEAWGWCQVSFLDCPSLYFFFQNEFLWTHSSSIQFRLNELQARIAGLQSVPRVLRILEIWIELSCLRGRHFADWAFSPSPLGLLAQKLIENWKQLWAVLL